MEGKQIPLVYRYPLPGTAERQEAHLERHSATKAFIHIPVCVSTATKPSQLQKQIRQKIQESARLAFALSDNVVLPPRCTQQNGMCVSYQVIHTHANASRFSNRDSHKHEESDQMLTDRRHIHIVRRKVRCCNNVQRRTKPPQFFRCVYHLVESAPCHFKVCWSINLCGSHLLADVKLIPVLFLIQSSPLSEPRIARLCPRGPREGRCCHTRRQGEPESTSPAAQAHT